MKHITIAAGAVALLVGLGMAAEPAATPAPATPAPAPAVKQQTNCPIMGGAVNKSVYADFDGKRVYFCCSGCPATFNKDPAKYIAKMEKDGITLDKTPATATPNATPAPAPAPMKGGCCQ